MKPETLELQNQLEPGCGKVVEVGERQFPIAVESNTGRFKYLVLGNHKEIAINNWFCVQASGIDRLDDNSGTEIPAASLIAELKAIISELETLPVTRVNHGNVFGTSNWYTFYCPNQECKIQLQNSGDCPSCKQRIDWMPPK